LARVYPLYLLVLLYVFARQPAGSTYPGWLEHTLALQAWDPSLIVAYAYNSPGWSIGVEFFLYAAFPALVMVVARLDRGVRPLVVVAAVAIITMLVLAAFFVVSGRAALSWRNPESAHRWLYRLPLLRLGDFVLGIVAARLYLRLRGARRARALGGALIAGGLLVAALLATSSAVLLSPASFDVAYAVPAFAVLLGLSLSPAHRVSRFLSLPLIILLGEASYAFYLVSRPMLDLIGSTAWSKAITVPALVIQGFNLAIILALAIGLHLVVEKPLRLWVRQRFSGVPHWRRGTAEPVSASQVATG
jgi:peptidoglycan/LPS O-acetylase OafA/YrhL